MKVANLSSDLTSAAWLAHSLPPRHQQQIAGVVATFFLKATFKLQPDQPVIAWEEGPLPPSGDVPMEDGGLRYPSDFVPFKPHGEVVVVGKAHGPGAGAPHAFEAAVAVGAWNKRIVIHGEREWKTTLLGEEVGPARPAVPTELTYANAWGGESVLGNPIGCGKETRQLPLIESPGIPIQNRDSVAVPAGLSPIPSSWPQRARKLGSYKDPWTQERWPWFPDDFDPGYFQSAPENQWLPGYWQGDEWIQLTNLMPGEPLYRTQLPGLRARCLVERSGGEQLPLEEVPMHLDTLWIDLDQEQLVMLWRGRCATSTVKLHDLAKVLLFTEPLEAPLMQDADYRADLEKHLAPLPDEPQVADEFPDVGQEVELELLQSEKARFEALAEAYTQAAEAAREYEKATKPMMEYAAGLLENVPASEESLAPPMSGPDEWAAHFNQELAAQGVDADFAKVLEPPIDPETLEAEAADKFAAKEAEFAALTESLSDARPREEYLLEDGSVDVGKLEESGASEVDLSGVDFSGLTLLGIDFRGARLTGASFREATLMGSDFQGADLTQADLSNAKLEKANLGETDLTACVVEGTDWRGVFLTGAILAGLDLRGADFTQVTAMQSDWTGCDLSGACFREANLLAATFAEAQLKDANFAKANLTYADFRRASAPAAIFRGANLVNLRAGEGADFTGADFQEAEAGQSNWEEGIVMEARFDDAILDGANFSDARADAAQFNRARLSGASFDDAGLHRVSFRQANLLRAGFDRADLRQAVLDGANVYDAGFWESRIEGMTWEGAFVKKTRLEV